MHNYDTVSEAITGLRKRGYDLDFDTRFDAIVCKEHVLSPEEFEITEIYRFEGNTDPADEAIVYGIASKHGLKGVLVNGYGPSSDPLHNDLVKKLTMKKD